MSPKIVAPRVAIIAALPREISGLVQGIPPESELRRRGIHLHRAPGAVIVAAGMGSARVTVAVEAALQEQSGVELLVSTGLAGACSPEIAAGEVVEASTVIDAKTGERFDCDTSDLRRVLVTTEAIAGVREKSRLLATYNAALVDMEAATVARLAAAKGLRFRALKGISDAHDFEMESLSRFADARGHFRTGAFALHTALRPGSWQSAMSLGRESNRALARLWSNLRSLIAETE
ncbi:MAG TPA: phosphorylase [Acidobacteriaceae bacterium]|nr:phosphorylase [Acidobacteriaceae bacterium]